MTKFCPLPWVGLHVTPQGNYAPCCKSKYSYGDSLQEYLTSEKLKTLKIHMLEDKQPQNCQACWQEESNNLPSLRQVYIEHKGLNNLENLENYKVLHLTFGNICNLTCRMCSSFASSKWKKEEKKLGFEKIFDFQRFYKDKSFLEDIKSISKNVIQITFSGGEVFYTGVAEHLEYLDFLIENNSLDLELEYITNATIFPNDEYWSRWIKFKSVKILLSIDGTLQKFEYIRYPAIWQECFDNILNYKSKEIAKKITISISHTVSFFNVFYLPEFYLWCLKEKLPMPYINMVNHPIEYNVQSLPWKVKEQLVNKFKQYKILDPVSNVLKDKNVQSMELSQILDKVHAVDQLRNQKFEQVFPEFAKLLLE